MNLRRARNDQNVFAIARAIERPDRRPPNSRRRFWWISVSYWKINENIFSPWFMKRWFCQDIYFRWRGVTPVCTMKWWESVLNYLNQWVTEYTLRKCIESGEICTVNERASHLRRCDLSWWELFSTMAVLAWKIDLLHYNKKSLSRTDYIKVMIVVAISDMPHGVRLLQS
jgi:hypothetical protein